MQAIHGYSLIGYLISSTVLVFVILSVVLQDQDDRYGRVSFQTTINTTNNDFFL